MSSKKIILPELFKGLQKQMLAQLNTNREFIDHPGSKGDSLENVWIEWLKKYLPNRYCVDKAIVIDSKGQLSDQIDLVIYDQQYTPFVFTQNGIHYVPAEGVYAIFEVKPDFKGSVKVQDNAINYIEYAGRKIESVRRLYRTSTNILDRGVPKPPRSLTKILGGILASENTIVKNETLEKHFQSLSGIQSIDMGCAIGFGAFYVEYEGDEDLNTNNFQERITNYYDTRKYEKMTFSKAENSLVSFFFQLMRYLQQTIGTVAAIDLGAYADTINFELDEGK
ncbi:DUF6602 domain-containing protein [Imperialibacter roseus]|uniref:DUF6602 domain-containing protein n=1 Tax=Imperialibacter roseus TaxID=1324217 RepID=A0ABZ0IVY1_9BACT|nr:DUF6602 domain-containing protein [Imperialibacter roseus]WOK09139.1 DUF6602 domain-containing protein [Imperialibacter roseus]